MEVALIHYRLSRLGGLQSRMKNYAAYFIGQGHRVTVIYASSDGEIALPGEVEQVQLHPGLVPKPYRAFAFDRKLGAFMQHRRFDLSLSLGRTSHQQLVLCPGNHLGYLQAMGRKPWRLTDRLQIRSDREAFTGSRLILAASQMMKEEVVRLYGQPEEKIKLLYPPLSLTDYPPVQPGEKQEARERLGLPADRPCFLFVSLSHQRKGLPLLLEVFSRPEMRHTQLIVVGGMGKKAPLPNIRFMGYRQPLRDFYLAADFLIHPSLYEPYGQVAAESLQCETPVILSPYTGAAELVGPEEGRVVPELTANAWLQALRQATPGSFHISPNFAARKQVTLQDHIRQMLEYAREEK